MNKTKRRRRYKSRRKSLRGGTTVPFSDLGNIFNAATTSIGNMFTFTVLPSGYNPPDTPGVENQFLTPSSIKINHFSF